MDPDQASDHFPRSFGLCQCLFLDENERNYAILKKELEELIKKKRAEKGIRGVFQTKEGRTIPDLVKQTLRKNYQEWFQPFLIPIPGSYLVPGPRVVCYKVTRIFGQLILLDGDQSFYLWLLKIM